MWWSLITATLLTSFVDSFNPIGITQQFVLQGMVKKPKHIWFFIVPTGIVNFIFGVLAYYGLTIFINQFWQSLMFNYSQIFYALEIVLGIIFISLVFYFIQNNKIRAMQKQLNLLSGQNMDNDESNVRKKVRSVTPLALISLGVITTCSELITALPYFAFIGILAGYQLSIVQLTLILILYNIIYAAPFMLMYFIYIKAETHFNRLYLFLKKLMSKFAKIILPLICGCAGIFFIVHAISCLL